MDSESNECPPDRSDLRDAINDWRILSATPGVCAPEKCESLAKQLIEFGQPLIAYDLIRLGLNCAPKHVHLRQLRALALVRSNAPRRAKEVWEELIGEGHENTETLGGLARVYKDFWQVEKNANKDADMSAGRTHLRNSHESYLKGFELGKRTSDWDGAIYTGVNAATTALLLDDEAGARALATEVAQLITDTKKADYWSLASLAECSLVLGRLEEARERYRTAFKVGGVRLANLASTRRNAAMLLEHRKLDRKQVLDWIPLPKVVVFSGHRVDTGDGRRRFDESQIDEVRQAIKQVLQDVDGKFGYVGAACGADLLFIEAMSEQRGEYHVVLALPEDAYIPLRVHSGGGKVNWRNSFDKAVRWAARKTVANEFSREGRREHFEYAHRMMTGLAMLHADCLDAEVVPLVVWDEQPSDQQNAQGMGTASVVKFWKEIGLEPIIINPLKLPSAAGRKASPTPGAVDPITDEPATDDEFRVEPRAMLFADVVNFSKLAEHEIQLFVTEFMAGIADRIEASGIRVESLNTWGDAIQLTTPTVDEAGRLALAIVDFVRSVNWIRRGFSSPLSLRIGLHYGPVFRFTEPITKRKSHTGAHVSKAARIEPITPSNEVYASEAFAAIAAAEKVTSFRCEFVGVEPMAKDYGDYPTYHVKRAAPTETIYPGS
jgi:class 3 adenylate cyclase/tetratricopeptide (TPR) repeat protein